MQLTQTTGEIHSTPNLEFFSLFFEVFACWVFRFPIYTTALFDELMISCPIVTIARFMRSRTSLPLAGFYLTIREPRRYRQQDMSDHGLR